MSAVIDVAGLRRLLDEPDRDVIVVDASLRLPSPRHDGDHRSESGRDDWASQHIPGSIHLDLAGELADRESELHYQHASPAALVAALAGHGIGPATTVVAYDQGDMMWSARLWWTLRWIGVEVLVLDGGLPAWAAGQPVTDEATAPRTPVEPWEPVVRLGHWADRHDIADIVAGRAPGSLVCGLGAEAFAGTAPTRYARRGHIPGSSNIPARGHIGPDGRLRPVTELAADYADLTTHPVVVYCGGGISASLNALALVESGADDPLLYDGSLEEWAADPSLPLR